MGGGVGGGLCTYIGVLESSYGRGNKEGIYETQIALEIKR